MKGEVQKTVTSLKIRLRNSQERTDASVTKKKRTRVQFVMQVVAELPCDLTIILYSQILKHNLKEVKGPLNVYTALPLPQLL